MIDLEKYLIIKFFNFILCFQHFDQLKSSKKLYGNHLFQLESISLKIFNKKMFKF